MSYFAAITSSHRAPSKNLRRRRQADCGWMVEEQTLEPSELVQPIPCGDRPRKASEVTHHIKSLIGVTCRVVLKSPGDVPRSQGKAVRVKDQRKKGT
jgi:hypothetical protein